MNLRALLPGIREPLTAALAPAAITPAPLDLASPWAPTHQLSRVLDGVVFADVFGPEVLPPLTRAEAMAVPAVARARHIIAGTVGAVPLRRYGRDGAELTEQGWASQTSGHVSTYHRNVWTVDDLLFYGWSCWSRVNGADGFPLRMDRVPWGRWSVDDVGRVYVADDARGGDHVLVDQTTVCLLPGPHEGILTAAAATIRHAADLQRAAAVAARHPAAYLVIQQTQGKPMPWEAGPEDPNAYSVSQVLADWRRERSKPDGGVGFLPLGLELKEVGTFDQHLVTEGRNAAAVDVARVCSLPADLLDAAGPSSLTYANARDNDVRAIQYGVGLYLRSMAAALSLDSVSPHGQLVRFDTDDWLENPVPAGASKPAVQPAARPAAPEPAA